MSARPLGCAVPTAQQTTKILTLWQNARTPTIIITAAHVCIYVTQTPKYTHDCVPVQYSTLSATNMAEASCDSADEVTTSPSPATAATQDRYRGRKRGVTNWTSEETDALLYAINTVKPSTAPQWEKALRVFREKLPVPAPRNAETMRRKLRELVLAGDPRAIQTSATRKQRCALEPVPEPVLTATTPANETVLASEPEPVLLAATPADEPDPKRPRLLDGLDSRITEQMDTLRAERKEMQATLNAILETVRLISTQLTQQ